MSALGTATARAWVTATEAAKMLEISRARVRQLVRDGHLASRRLPGTWPQISRSEVEALAAKYTRGARM